MSMRRVLFGGVGLALSLFGASASGQDVRTSSPQQQDQPQRGVKLGRPMAIPDTPPVDSGAASGGSGVLRVRGETPIPTPMPPAPAPSPPVILGIPTSGFPLSGGTPVIPIPNPPGTTAPMITEDRGASAGSDPTMLGDPTVLPGSPAVVPSVAPNGVIGLPPGLEAPIYGDCPTGEPAMGRVRRIGQWAFSAEYLMWWTRAADLPPLITTSSPQFNGQLGRGDTTTVLSGPFGETFHSGERFTAVRWFGDSECRGIEGRIFFLGQAASSFTATTGTFPLLARPFFNTNPSTPFFGSDSEIVAETGLASGGVTAQLKNSLWGAEANYRRNLWCSPCGRLDAIVGYRYLDYSEKLTVTESFLRTGQPPAGTTGVPVVAGTVVDMFQTRNQFNGGQIGLAGELRRGRWSLDGRVTVAFGDLSRTADISGGQALLLANGQRVNANGGLLALPGANIGHFSDDVFSVIPEVGVNLGYQITSRLRVFVGYNFLYIGNVLRPANVIDPFIDAARIPNFPQPGNPMPLANIHPVPLFHSTGFFVQGISFGLQFTW